MKIHREGNRILLNKLFFFAVANAISWWMIDYLPIKIALSIASILLYLFFIRFFRKPIVKLKHDDSAVYAPAEGKIVVVEEVEEKEYFNDKRKQVSIFMSIWDAHVNWIPIAGKVVYKKYHPGKYLVAYNPKSSELNERSTVVIRTKTNTEILIRQIAGAVARRISTYPEDGQLVAQNDELGYIKFGSRVDVLLPVNTEVKVQLKQKVKGNRNILARLK
jgi:phosphatidylserine decarboxylase